MFYLQIKGVSRVKKNLISQIMLVLIISSLFLSTPDVGAKSTNKEKTKDYKYKLKQVSTEILTGEVISVSSRWINTSKSRNIYSFVYMTITDVKKTSLSEHPKTIEFVYPGGTVGGFSEIVTVSPGGEFYCYPNQIISVYLVYNSNFDMFKAIRIEDLNPSLRTMGIERAILQYLYEDQGINFEFAYAATWSSGDMPIHYRINNNTADCTGEYTAVSNAFQTWEAASYSAYDFTLDGTTTITTCTYYDEGGNVNVVFWGDLDPTDLAICHLWVIGSSAVGFDIEFDDDDHEWCIGSVSNEYDVENCAAHEVGHVCVIGDLYDSSNDDATMYDDVYDDETKKRSLEQGDKDGAQYTLPSNSKPSVSISEPDDLDTVSGSVRITAAVSGGTISNVKYKIADVGTFDYDGGWVSMTKSGSDYIADWNTLEVPDDDYYITVRAETSSHIYGYDYVRVTTQND